MNYLDMVNSVQQRLGIDQTKGTQSKTDADLVQINAWFNEQLRELAESHNWSVLHRNYFVPKPKVFERTASVTAGSPILTISSTTGLGTAFSAQGKELARNSRVLGADNSFHVTLDQPAISSATATTITFLEDTFLLPVDYDRMVDNTLWSNSWPIPRGPSTASQWEWTRHSGMTIRPPQVRLFGNLIRVYPPGTNSPVSFEYISKNAVTDAGGGLKDMFNSDADTTYLDAETLILGVIARWRIHQKFDGSSELDLYNKRKSKKISEDGGSQVVSLTGNRYRWRW